MFSTAFGATAYAMVCREVVLRDVGACMNPFAAFLLLQGLETLSLRAERHSQNALALARCVASSELVVVGSAVLKAPWVARRWLEQHPKVSWVSYLGLESHASHNVAQRILRPGLYGGMLNFGVKGDAKAGSAVVDGLRLASNLANVGQSSETDARRDFMD